MKHVVLLGLLLWGYLGAATRSVEAQGPPPFDEYRAWAAEHAIGIDNLGFDTGLSDLAALGSVVGDARVVGFSEPFHGAHEPLALRNRLLEYLVTELGFTAIALETGLSPSKLLYDYVLGGPGEAGALAREAFSARFGLFQENVDLLEWLRAYNQTVPSSRAVRLYGVDLTGHEISCACRSLEAVIEFLRETSLPGAAPVREAVEEVIPLFRFDVYPELTSVQKDQITVTIDRLLAYLDHDRADLVALVGVDNYAWSRRQAVAAHQDNAFLRYLEDPWALREAGMADNLRWVLDREGPTGRVMFFANNTHTGSHRFSLGRDLPSDWPTKGLASAGFLLRRELGSDLVTIGTYFGEGVGDFWFMGGGQPFPQDDGGIDALLGSISFPTYLIDLRALPASGRLGTWMRMEHETRLFNRYHLRFAPADAFDAILYINRLTPATRVAEDP